uniref:Uncharacterized protein n=1 Tax=Petromyzon marinus TaxID=7757 RepID=S4RHM2_PETMA
EVESMEPTQGMSVETAVGFLQRLMAMVDVLVLASSLNFSEIEAEKNMSSGGLLRQCLRLICCVAVRNCLDCRSRQRGRGGLTRTKSQETVHSLVGMAQSSLKSPVESSCISPVKDTDRLLQDVDIGRLRAVVFRDVEDSKQAQFLALAVVYFISVLMVSKYRDILEPQREMGRRDSQRSKGTRPDLNSPSSAGTGPPASSSHALRGSAMELCIPRTDSGIGDDQPGGAPSLLTSPEQPDSGNNNNNGGGNGGGGNGGDGAVATSGGAAAASAASDAAVGQLLCSLSGEVRRPPPAPCADEATSNGTGSGGKGVSVKDILRSLVAAPTGEPVGPAEPAPSSEVVEPRFMLPMQFHSFDRSVVVPAKKGSSGGLVSTTGELLVEGAPGSAASGFASTISAASQRAMINTTGEVAPAPAPPSSSFVNGATSRNLPAVQTVAPLPEDSMENTSITTKLERALEKVAPLLREIFVDFAQFLSRTLLGSHGQELLIEGLVCMKSSTSVVELVHLICQVKEWQNSIQKNAGLAFIELINEGR